MVIYLAWAEIDRALPTVSNLTWSIIVNISGPSKPKYEVYYISFSVQLGVQFSSSLAGGRPSPVVYDRVPSANWCKQIINQTPNQSPVCSMCVGALLACVSVLICTTAPTFPAQSQSYTTIFSADEHHVTHVSLLWDC